MKVDPERVLRSTSPLSGVTAPGWRLAAPLLVLALASVFALYWTTAASMAAIWGRSETFTHGYVIVPIALLLVWRKRHEVAALAPRWDYLGLVLLAGAGFAWLVATAGHVQVMQQYAMTAMFPAAVVAVAGRRVAGRLAFPLAFLLFAVPAGEGLLPRLMEFTADFTVAALRLTGIPVYREGNFFAIPSGRWSVVEACGGLRYLIASVTVGAVYAYLNYRRFWKRALFVALSIVVPILANGLRAYIIVMLGHLSGMKLAVGVDHFIYGWVFFGVVIALLFWLGSFWRDPPAAPRAVAFPGLQGAQPSRGGFAAAALSVVAVSAAWPLYAASLDARPAHTPVAGLASPLGAAGWKAEAQPLTDWRPHYLGAASSAFQVYRKDARTVALYIAQYRHQRQGAELVSSLNAVAGAPQAAWVSTGQASRVEHVGGEALLLRETRLRSPGQAMLAWDWYRVSGRDLSDPYLAKALLARDKLLGRSDEGAALVLATPYAERAEDAQATLRQFMQDMRGSIDAALAGRAAGQSL